MAINVTKPAINLREKLNEVTLETGIKGEELLNSDTSTEARNVLELDTHLFTDFESTGIDDNATSTKLTVSATGIDVTGNVVVSGTVTATGVDLGNWTLTESAGVLYFATGGTNKMKLDASGNLTVVGDVTAFGTI